MKVLVPAKLLIAIVAITFSFLSPTLAAADVAPVRLGSLILVFAPIPSEIVAAGLAIANGVQIANKNARLGVGISGLVFGTLSIATSSAYLAMGIADQGLEKLYPVSGIVLGGIAAGLGIGAIIQSRQKTSKVSFDIHPTVKQGGIYAGISVAVR